MKINLYEKDNNRTVCVTTNDEIYIELVENPTAGYLWKSSESSAVILEEVKHEGNESDLIGAPRKVIFLFKVVTSGSINISYARPFEQKPIQWFNIKIEIK